MMRSPSDFPMIKVLLFAGLISASSSCLCRTIQSSTGRLYKEKKIV